MRRAFLPAALAFAAACGTEIEADQHALELAAALPFEGGTTTSADAMPGAASSGAPLPAVEYGPMPAAAAAPRGALVATLYTDRDVEVGARVDGSIRLVQAELGDAVEEGTILAILEDGIELAAVASAEAELDLARAEHGRVAALHEQRVVPPAELELAVYRLRATQAALDDARARLERTRVRAPFAGFVSRRFVRLGQSVESGDPLFRVTAPRPLRALLRLPELAAAAVRPGDAVVLETLDGRQVRARVARVAPAIDPGSGTVEVLVAVLDPRGLPPGATVTARFPER